jgi:hypothetical protein
LQAMSDENEELLAKLSQNDVELAEKEEIS